MRSDPLVNEFAKRFARAAEVAITQIDLWAETEFASNSPNNPTLKQSRCSGLAG
jgi:hypothetical protein